MKCSSCKCELVPEPICGNGVVEGLEECEVDTDCLAGMRCLGCGCAQPPVPAVEMPAPVIEKSTWQRFVGWIQRLFGKEPELQMPVIVEGVNCANNNQCRVWDRSCGGAGLEMLMRDSMNVGCVDVQQASQQGVQYCSRLPKVMGSAPCNFMDPRTKSGCVCY